MDRRLFKKFVPRGLSAPASGLYIIHVYNHNIQTSSLKPMVSNRPTCTYIDKRAHVWNFYVPFREMMRLFSTGPLPKKSRPLVLWLVVI